MVASQWLNNLSSKETSLGEFTLMHNAQDCEAFEKTKNNK